MMKKSRTNFLRIFFCIILLFTNSCITKALWGDKSYLEKIHQFFIGEDGRYVALLGNNYHYVFNDNSGLLRMFLSLKQRDVLTINIAESYLKLHSNNDLSGDFIIDGPFNYLPEEDKYYLQSLGFKPDINDNIKIKMKLVGRRYAAKNIGQTGSDAGVIDEIKIHYSDGNLVKGLGKVAVTPITVTLDAVVLIGKVVLYPFID